MRKYFSKKKRKKKLNYLLWHKSVSGEVGSFFVVCLLRLHGTRSLLNTIMHGVVCKADFAFNALPF